jgi:flagellar hook-associated protein 1 FlgK
MPISSFMGLQTALSGLQADQEAINTTGQNIANANTPGYSRQVVNLQAAQPLSLPALSSLTGTGAQLGTGVDATTISRIRNLFLDVQYRTQNSATSNAATQQTTLQQAQTALDEPSSNGISAQLTNFWNAWGALANAPTSTAALQAVVDSGTTLTQTINQVDAQLATVQSQAAQHEAMLTGPSGQLMTDATQIASLNNQISQSMANGQTPNDLLDQRDQLLDDLSSLGNIKVTNQSNGMVQVNFGDAAQPLISGTGVNWPQAITAATGGSVGALISESSPTGQVGQYMSMLDGVANQLITSVNGLTTSSPFFSGTNASNIAVAATPSTVQTGSAGAGAGANDVAQAVAALAGGPVDQGYDAFVSHVGSDVSATNSTQQTASNLLGAIDSQRQSVSGVSLDEEMTNLISFQRGYQASARIMTTIDSTLDTLINHTGMVGL